jgi:hypothetical protein
MQHKKTQIAPKHDGRAPLVGVTGVGFGERSGCESLVADLRSIVSAAHKLPAEVAPPARVWRSLRSQLEKEGILSGPVKGKLQGRPRKHRSGRLSARWRND